MLFDLGKPDLFYFVEIINWCFGDQRPRPPWRNNNSKNSYLISWQNSHFSTVLSLLWIIFLNLSLKLTINHIFLIIFLMFSRNLYPQTKELFQIMVNFRRLFMDFNHKECFSLINMVNVEGRKLRCPPL